MNNTRLLTRSAPILVLFGIRRAVLCCVVQGDVHKRKEIVQDVTLHDLDSANARPAGGQDIMRWGTGLQNRHQRLCSQQHAGHGLHGTFRTCGQMLCAPVSRCHDCVHVGDVSAAAGMIVICRMLGTRLDILCPCHTMLRLCTQGCH